MINEEQQTHLVPVERINAMEVFTGKGMADVLSEISNKVSVLVPDVTSVKGRKEIASMANKIARSKTLLDDIGKELVSDWKAKAKVVDDVRKNMRDCLDELKEKTRSPLTQWEENEAKRVFKYQQAWQEIVSMQHIPHNATVDQIQAYVDKLNLTEITDEFGEFKERSIEARDKALSIALQRKEERKIYDQQQEELAVFKKQEADRLAAEQLRFQEEAKKEQQEMLRRELEERARLQAELKVQNELRKAENERLAAVKAAEESQKRANEAELKLKKEQEEVERKKAELKVRAKNKEDAMSKAVTALVNLDIGLIKLQAEEIVCAIAGEKIPHMVFKE